MAGNSRRRGATRKAGSKKGATTGSGGKNRRALEGKGPTPKAEDRPYHKAYKAKQAQQRRTASAPQRGVTSSRSHSGARVHPGAGGQAGVRAHVGGENSEIVAGRNSVLEALRAKIPATAVYVSARIEADQRVREILRLAGVRNLPLLEVMKPELDKMTDGAVHQGVALHVPPYEYKHPDDLLAIARKAGEVPFIVALDSVTDPRNLGAIVRSAGAFGVHGVVIPERRAAGVTASAWKVSAGAAARVPVASASNLNRALLAYKKAGVFVVGLDAGGDADVSDLNVASDPVVVVVGSEGKGLSRLVKENCDFVASITMTEATESLNASVAAGIALYEVARQRAN